MIAILDQLDVSGTKDTPDADLATVRRRGGGPRTPEGKERSRRNALKHGLRARVIMPDDLAEAVAERTDDLDEEYGPRSPYEEFLVGQVALASVRLERCAEMGIEGLRRIVERAQTCWDSDRGQAVEDLGARLPRDPARVARALRGSRHGADWLIERWEGLGDAVRSNGGWDDAQRRLAFDLLGVPPELRNGSAKVPPASDALALAALAARQIARLREDREAVLDELDEAERAMAASGMPMEEDAATARLRKYEASCRRALHWAQAELRRSRAESTPVGESSRTASAPVPAKETGRDLSNAAIDYLAKRSEAALTASIASAQQPAEVPLSSASSATPRNRRERRARESRDRQAAGRAALAGASR